MNISVMVLIIVVLLALAAAPWVFRSREGADDEMDRYLKEQCRQERARERTLNQHSQDGSCLTPEEGKSRPFANIDCRLSGEGRNNTAADTKHLFSEARDKYSHKVGKKSGAGIDPGRVQSALDRGTTRWSSSNTPEKNSKGKFGAVGLLVVSLSIAVSVLNLLTSDWYSSLTDDDWRNDAEEQDAEKIYARWDYDVDCDPEEAEITLEETEFFDDGTGSGMGFRMNLTYREWEGEEPMSPELEVLWDSEEGETGSYLWRMEYFGPIHEEEEGSLTYRRTYDVDGSSRVERYEEGALTTVEEMDPLGELYRTESYRENGMRYTEVYNRGELEEADLWQGDDLIRVEVRPGGKLEEYHLYIWGGEKISPTQYELRYHYVFDRNHDLIRGEVEEYDEDGLITGEPGEIPVDLKDCGVTFGDDGFADDVILPR